MVVAKDRLTYAEALAVARQEYRMLDKQRLQLVKELDVICWRQTIVRDGITQLAKLVVEEKPEVNKTKLVGKTVKLHEGVNTIRILPAKPKSKQKPK